MPSATFFLSAEVIIRKVLQCKFQGVKREMLYQLRGALSSCVRRKPLSCWYNVPRVSDTRYFPLVALSPRRLVGACVYHWYTNLRPIKTAFPTSNSSNMLSMQQYRESNYDFTWRKHKRKVPLIKKNLRQSGLNYELQGRARTAAEQLCDNLRCCHRFDHRPSHCPAKILL